MHDNSIDIFREYGWGILIGAIESKGDRLATFFLIQMSPTCVVEVRSKAIGVGWEVILLTRGVDITWDSSLPAYPIVVIITLSHFDRFVKPCTAGIPVYSRFFTANTRCEVGIIQRPNAGIERCRAGSE